MDKKYLHHIWTRLRPIRSVYFLIPAVILGGVCVIALRDNNIRMVQLRQAVYTADEQNKDVEAALQKLRIHIYGHMNTSLHAQNSSIYPPLQLKYTYQRLQQAEQQRLQQTNSKLYTEAQETCEKEHPDGFSGRGRVPCIEEYVSSHGGTVRTIPDALYKFDFVSPTWSPDLAGWTMVASIVCFLLFVARLLGGLWLRRTTE